MNEGSDCGCWGEAWADAAEIKRSAANNGAAGSEEMEERAALVIE
jgi:hypothetical protein